MTSSPRLEMTIAGVNAEGTQLVEALLPLAFRIFRNHQKTVQINLVAREAGKACKGRFPSEPTDITVLRTSTWQYNHLHSNGQRSPQRKRIFLAIEPAVFSPCRTVNFAHSFFCANTRQLRNIGNSIRSATNHLFTQHDEPTSACLRQLQPPVRNQVCSQGVASPVFRGILLFGNRHTPRIYFRGRLCWGSSAFWRLLPLV